MTTVYALHPDSYICIDPRYCVFLNARSDKYLAVATQTLQRLAPWLSGWPLECHPTTDQAPQPEIMAIAADLIRRGILTTSRQHAKPVRPQNIPKPSRSILDGLPGAPLGTRLRLAGRVLRSRLWAQHRLSHDSLVSILQSVASRRPLTCSIPEVTPAFEYTLISVFDAWRGLYSRPNTCLLDALSLLHFLAGFDIFPAWVFGVLPEPFQAHCWLQCNDLVLNDSLQHVQDYRPIMLV